MSQPRATTLNDIADSITTFGNMITERLYEMEASLEARIDCLNNSLVNRIDGFNSSLNNRIDGLYKRMLKQEKAQSETNKRLAIIEGRLEAIGNEIKDLSGE
jgi:hypothetical protein